MWESPVKVLTKEIHFEMEGQIMKAMQDIDVIVDKDELIRAMNYDRNQYDKVWKDCQEMVEQKCRKLGIDYIAIFTEDVDDI